MTITQIVAFVLLVVGIIVLLVRRFSRPTRATALPATGHHHNVGGTRVLLEYFRTETEDRSESMVAEDLTDEFGNPEPDYMLFCGPKEETLDQIDPIVRLKLLRAKRVVPTNPSNPRHREAGKPFVLEFAKDFGGRQTLARRQGAIMAAITAEDIDNIAFCKALYAEDPMFYNNTLLNLGSVSTGGKLTTADGQRGTDFLMSHLIKAGERERLRGRPIRTRTEGAITLAAVKAITQPQTAPAVNSSGNTSRSARAS